MKKLHIITLTLSFMLVLCSCGQNTEEILKFQNELNNVVLQIEALNQGLNDLDVTLPDASDTALSKLHDLEQSFQTLAKIKVTDSNHAYISDLAKEGSEYMSQAYDLYEKAYGQAEIDLENADLAYKYLERATTRIRVIVTMLHGVIPEGVVVH